MITTKITKPRGRPAKLDREKAAEAAMRLFWQKGYDSVGVAELSEVIGVKPPSLYAAFGNKVGLLREAAALYARRDGRFVADVAPLAASADVLLSGVLKAAAEAYTIDPETRGCLILDGTRNSADVEARTEMWRLRQSTRDYLAAEFARVDADAPEALAEYTLVCMTGLSGSARDGVDRETLLSCAALMAAGRA